jgi:hypothetical protein
LIIYHGDVLLKKLSKKGLVAGQHLFTDIYTIHSIDISNTLLALRKDFFIMRTSFLAEEVNRGYVHPHFTTGIPIDDKYLNKFITHFLNNNSNVACLGDSLISDTVMNINKSLSKDDEDTLLLDVSRFVTYLNSSYLATESDLGVPYFKIERIFDEVENVVKEALKRKELEPFVFECKKILNELNINIKKIRTLGNIEAIKDKIEEVLKFDMYTNTNKYDICQKLLTFKNEEEIDWVGSFTIIKNAGHGTIGGSYEIESKIPFFFKDKVIDKIKVTSNEENEKDFINKLQLPMENFGLVLTYLNFKKI